MGTEDNQIQTPEEQSGTGSNRKMTTLLAIVGALMGIPLSYYFQSEMVRAKVGGVGGYMENFGDILSEGDLAINVFFGVVVFGIIGAILGYIIDSMNATTKN
jgi:hypothetical protein